MGSRNYPNLQIVKNYLIKQFSFDDILVSGGAQGVDKAAEEEANKLGFSTIIFLPDWQTHGKAAGFIRNGLIVEAADVIVCFWSGNSRGCIDTVRKAKKANKSYEIYGPNGERLR